MPSTSTSDAPLLDMTRFDVEKEERKRRGETQTSKFSLDGDRKMERKTSECNSYK